MITISALVHNTREKCWQMYNSSDHVVHWNFASTDWYCPKAESQFVEGGHFTYTMEAKDGSFSFDFAGTYDQIHFPEKVYYHLEDLRKVIVIFESMGKDTLVTINFEPENENPQDLQKQGWQAILNNFKNYAETH